MHRFAQKLFLITTRFCQCKT